MTRTGRKSSIPTQATEPITFHHGWGKLGWEPDQAPTEVESQDQTGSEVEHRVPLSTQPTVLMSDGSSRQQYLTAYLEQRADGTALRVFIGQNDDAGLEATLDEARRFAVGILALFDGHKEG